MIFSSIISSHLTEQNNRNSQENLPRPQLQSAPAWLPMFSPSLRGAIFQLTSLACVWHIYHSSGTCLSAVETSIMCRSVNTMTMSNIYPTGSTQCQQYLDHTVLNNISIRDYAGVTNLPAKLKNASFLHTERLQKIMLISCNMGYIYRYRSIHVTILLMQQL